MKALYKILFEVMVLHEYYLTESDQSSVFDPANIQDPAGYLSMRMQEDRPSVTGNIRFRMRAPTAELFKNQRMRLLNSYSGFQVAIEVRQSTLPDGSTVYTPLVPLSGDSNMLFLVEQVAAGLDRISNGRMQREVGSLYYFCNEQLAGPKAFPVLSNAIPARPAAYAYEQGELVNIKGAISAYYYNGTKAAFQPVPGDGFANESDRVLVAPAFTYTFKKTDAVTNASFSLKDPAGKIVRTRKVSGTLPLDTVSLDFAADPTGKLAPLVTLPAARLSDPVLYTLTVTGNGGYSKTWPLLFYDDPAAMASSWGLIQVQAAVSNNAYSLLDGSGRLVTRKLADGTVSPAPAFQVRCKSLFPFRRYVNDRGLSLSAPAGNMGGFLQQTGTKQTGFQLTTLIPVPLTYLPYFFSLKPKAQSPTFVYLPAPEPGEAIDFSNNQFFYVIRVPESKLFPIS